MLQLFDISTTVDPSYVISLIRKLLPTEVKDEGISAGQETEELKTASVSASENGEGVWASNENEAADMDDNFNKVDKFLGLDVRLCCKSTKKGSSAGEEAWEEYGCILWDLAASKTHAEFMVLEFSLSVHLSAS